MILKAYDDCSEFVEVRFGYIEAEFIGNNGVDTYSTLGVERLSCAKASDGGTGSDWGNWGRYIPLTRNARLRHAKKQAKKAGWL